jgi:hypothetical protein
MTLQKNIFRIQLGRGADTSATDIVLEPGQLEVLENAVIQKAGRLEKRKGCSSTNWDLSSVYNPLSTFSYRDNLIIQGDETVIGLVGSDNEIVAFSGLGLSSYFESELFHASGSGGYHQIQPSIALSHSGDYFAIAYVQGEWDPDQNAVRYAYRIDILDAVTGTIVNSNRGIANRGNDDDFIGKIKVVAHGDTDAADDNFAAYYEFRDSSGNISIRKAKFKHDAFTISGSDIVASSVYRQTEGENWFDVIEYTAGSGNYQKVHLVYTEYSSSTHYATYQLDTNGSLGSAAKVNAGAAMKHMTAYKSSAGGTARVYYAFSVGTTVHIRQHTEADPTSGAVGGTDVISGTVMVESGGWCDSEDGAKVEYWCTMGTTSSTYLSKTCRYQVTGGTGAFDDDAAPTRQNSWISLPPIKTSAGIHHFLSQENRNTEDNDTSLHTVVAWQDHIDDPTGLLLTWYKSIVGSTFRQELIRSHINGITPRFVYSGGYYYSALPRATNLQTWANTSTGAVTTAINSQCHLIKISVDKPVYETPRVQLGGELYVAPGSIKSTSGERVHEAGFYYKPGLALTAAAAGSLDSSGVYKYKACWEWEDSFGNLHRSEPSSEETITLTGSDTGVTVTCDGLAMSIKGMTSGGLRLVLYRTQNAGNIFNRVATIENPPIDSTFTGTDLISHHDKVSDSNAATEAFLYTEGGVLPNVAPPPARYIESHLSRIFAITEDNRIWFSKEYENKVGLGWSDEFQIDLDGISHDKPMALCSSGNELVIFREHSTWSVAGEGPAKTGVGEFYKPRQISATIGALKNSPTLYTDGSVYFQNVKGIFRMSGNGFEYIGSPVKDLLGSSRVISIRHHQETETIRFALSDKVLSFNYRQDAWANYTYSLADGETIVGMENIDDTIYVVTSADKILKEDTSYKIGSTYMPLKLKTGWISFNEIMGFGRVYRFSILGESRDKHIMTVKVYYDYDDSAVVDTYTFTTSSATDAKLQFRAHLSKQKCEAVKFEIYDADNSATTGDGFAIDHIALEVGLKKGVYRTTETNTTGAD